MKTHPVILLPLLTLIAASASARQFDLGSELNYNRIGVGYEANDSIKSMVVSGEAKLGDHLLVGGSYSDVTGKGDYDGFTGNIARFGVGAVITAGPGDLILRASYGQGNLRSNVELGVADERSFGLSYRATLGSGLEGELGYARVRTRMVGDWLSTTNDNVVKASLRYNFSRSLDLTVSYAFQSKDVGGNSFGASLGFSF
jgi:hypothetical protein